MRLTRLAGAALIAVVVTVAGFYGVKLARYATVVTSLAAHTVAGAMFVTGLDEETVTREDVAELRRFPIRYTIDRDRKRVAASLPGGLARREAVFRPGLGVSLASGISASELAAQPFTLAPVEPEAPDTIPWPTGDRDSELTDRAGIDEHALRRAVDAAFAEPDPDRPALTRAVVVAYRGQIVAERYARGIGRDTPLISWSMGKSVTSALTGIWLHRRGLDAGAPVEVAEWRTPGDPRSAITYANLLQMSSGLDYVQKPRFPEIRDEYREVMLEPDAGRYAADRPLRSPPGREFYYMNGSSNLLQRVMREQLGGAYAAFPRVSLFNPVGMRTMLLAPDSSGTFVGSSLCWASARDWIRFGLLYSNDGVWEGTRILPEGWVAFTRKPATARPPKGGYGASFWLNTPDGSDRGLAWPELPADAFTAQGSEGQILAIIPSKQLVIVRLGMTKPARGARFDRIAFVSAVAKSFPSRN